MSLVYHDKREATTQDIEDYYKLVKQINDTQSKIDTKQLEAEVTVSTSDILPVGIVFTGDWHVGAQGVDYELLERDLGIIEQTEGLYAIGMGDYKDNQNPYVHQSGVFEENVVASGQDKIVKHLISSLGDDKWVALVRGCHDDWDKKLTDRDFVQELCDSVGCVNLWHGGKLTLHVGSEVYTVHVRHKYKYDSSLNTTNSQRNLANNFGAFDVIALAHKHYPDLQVSHRMGQEIIYLRSGTYKTYDEFGQKIGGYKGIYGTPVLILFPDSHRKLLVPDLVLGAQILRGLRHNY